MNSSISPIKDVTFEGLHWIEASAGSGKTFTLSSLMVRALLEAYMPDQIVATTFTRAATAELKERIRARLVEVQRLLEKRKEMTAHSNIALADEMESTDELMAHILRMFSSSIGHACQRVKLVIEQLDRLYVGTLDSFSQKILREFAFESGRVERMEITENARRYTQQIIHDVVRAWVNKQTQEVVNSLYNRGEIKTVEAYTKLVEDSLNFSNAEFRSEPNMTDQMHLIFGKIYAYFEEMQDWDLSLLKEYSDPNGAYFEYLNGQIYRNKYKFTSVFDKSIPMLFEALSNRDCLFCVGAGFQEHLVNLNTLLVNIEKNKVFTNKLSEGVRQEFYSHRYFVQLGLLLKAISELDDLLTSVGTSLKFYICQEVKARLPGYLQVKNETTFTQQIKTIADALGGSNGDIFANAVHQKYPLIIVDEFQDTNQDQDNILASIWRHPDRIRKGCMIMVGDRKQAIYGFRGGDMLTFVKAYNDVLKKGGRFYNLVFNHRTVAPLVEVVDALFRENPDFGEYVQYTPVSAGNRPHPALVEMGYKNPTPLRYIQLGKEDDAHIQTAYQVIKVLNQGQRGELCFESDGGITSVTENDVAVLAKSNEDLDRIQYELERRGVTVDRPSRRSVFEGILAIDVGALLTAVLYPNDDLKVRRALTSILLGYSINDVSELEQNADKLANIVSSFRVAHDLWFDRGFLTAWQFIMEHFNVWENLLSGSGKDCERNVVNMRHISEILSQYHSTFTGPQSLEQWYLRQISKPSEREWELERNLSSANGVKLMTIHKSKGLEYPIVFLFKATGAIKEIRKTLNYSIRKEETNDGLEDKRVIHIGSDPSLSADELNQHQHRLEAENRRQWYVALTRASHRVYLLMGEPKPGAGGVAYWWYVNGFKHPNCVQESVLDGCEYYTPVKPLIKEIVAYDIPNVRFYGKGVANFTSISKYLNHSQGEDFLADKYLTTLKEDEFYEAESSFAYKPEGQLLFMAKNFSAGTLPGTFLHKVLDELDFQAPETWRLDIIKKLKNSFFLVYSEMMNKYAQQNPSDTPMEVLQDQLASDLEEWFSQIIGAKTSSGFGLHTLKKGSYLSEMPFVLSLADRAFNTSKITQILADYGVVMPELNRSESARFLNGSIDLVYEFNGKYYVADYKGNLLGHNYEDYSHESIRKNMSKSSYFLQATLYLVALHRFLKLRLSDYSIEKHLGGSLYMYLRGMQANSNLGMFEWNPDHSLILKIDSLLGQFDYKGRVVSHG